MINSDLGVFVVLLGVVGGCLWGAEQKLAGRLFEFVPPILLIFIACMILGNSGVLPEESDTYFWIKRHLMPFSIFLFMLSVNVRAIFRIGRLATVMIFVGMASVTFAFILSTFLFSPWLGSEAWAPIVASYAGSIGGSQNLIAMAETLDASPSILGAMIAVDSLVGYAFLAVLVSLASHKAKFNKWLRAKEETIEMVNELSLDHVQEHQPASSGGFAMIVCLGLAASVICRFLGDFMPSAIGSEFISSSVWTLIFVVTSGLFLSLTRVRELNAHGTFQIGQVSLYLIMAVLGAGALVENVWEYRIFMIFAPVLLLISLTTILLIGRALRVPMVMVVTGLYANIGGTVTNPIIAAAYNKGFVSSALLMAIVTQIVGMYIPLFIAPIIRSILA